MVSWMLAVSKISDLWGHVTAFSSHCSSLDLRCRIQILPEAGIDSPFPIVLLYKGSVGHLMPFVTIVTCICSVKLPKAESRRVLSGGIDQ